MPCDGSGFGGVRGDGVRRPVKLSPSSFCTGSCDTEFLHFSTLIGVKPFPRFIEREQKLLLFTLQYPSLGTRVFLWNIIKKVYFLQRTQTNKHAVDLKSGGRQELDPRPVRGALWGLREARGRHLRLLLGCSFPLSACFSAGRWWCTRGRVKAAPRWLPSGLLGCLFEEQQHCLCSPLLVRLCFLSF